MNDSLELIKKIHTGIDETCYASILANWSKMKIDGYEIAERLFDLVSSGVSEEAAAEICEIDHEEAKALLDEYGKKYCNITDNDLFYDRLFTKVDYFDACERVIKNKETDVYFSLNSFYRSKRLSKDVRHINAFVLDFDFYKIDKFKDKTPGEFYKVIKEKLPFNPTAVVDSGRGLYVIYSFKHCSYHMTKLYESIMKFFFDQFDKYGMDPLAQLVTQVIRIPGTINSKSGRTVSIIEMNDTDYKIQDFAHFLPWTVNEVKEYKNLKVTKKYSKIIKKKITKKKNHFKPYFEDFKKLIMIRNKSNNYCTEGYREQLLYLLQDKACQMGYSSSEAVDMALELNEFFNKPMTANEVKQQCKPSGDRRVRKIDTIITKLSINIEEQKQMKVLKKRWLKKSEYAKRKNKHPLLNRTKAQMKRLERKKNVLWLKVEEKLNNSAIARKLGIDRGTVIADLKYIKNNPSEFIKKLEVYLQELEEYSKKKVFTLKELYQDQLAMLEFLLSGYKLLEKIRRQESADYG